MMNVFLLDYFSRLQSWHDLRNQASLVDTKHRVVLIDTWWQQAPQITHYLHPDYIKDWPNPWELLNENKYCPYSRALGMVYTFLLLGEKDLELVDATDDNNEDVVLVLVDRAKYQLNYWPGTVLNNKLADFSVKRKLDISPLYDKIG